MRSRKKSEMLKPAGQMYKLLLWFLGCFWQGFIQKLAISAWKMPIPAQKSAFPGQKMPIPALEIPFLVLETPFPALETPFLVRELPFLALKLPFPVWELPFLMQILLGFQSYVVGLVYVQLLF